MQVDANRQIIWLLIGAPFELHCSYKTICNFYDSLNIISETVAKENIKQMILVSANKKVWNMGGDLEMFSNSILQQNESLIKDYAYKCIEVLTVINKRFYSDVIITFFVQGNAFGGGFECVLSGDYVIAEEHTKFSFPEVLFGILPGMGAYSFLARKIGVANADEIVNSGRKWTAKEMQQMGLVDFVCDKGQSVETVLDKIENGELTHDNNFKKVSCQVPLAELKQIVDIWLNNILKLDTPQILYMQKIVRAQKIKAMQWEVGSSW